MAPALLIRPVEHADAITWMRMRTALWPDDAGSHAADVARFFSPQRSEPLEVLIACSGSGAPLGFVELSIRPHVAGCTSDRVAFVDGWYVDPDHRRRGVGAALIRGAEEWGRANKCTELGSDTQRKSL